MKHVIADEALEKAEIALAKGKNWIAYDESVYFIDKDDVHFFDNENLAKEFKESHPAVTLIHLSSLRDLFVRVPYDHDAASPVLRPEPNNKQLSLFNLKTNVMNEQNLEYLKDNIKYMGFGENLNAQLENQIKEGKETFQLGFRAEINKKPFEATLHFGKSESTDKYFFNSFDASLQKANGEKVDQTFYLNKGKGITAKEAFNLLDGRAVHKELTNKENVPYQAWVQLDFQNKDKHNNYEVKQFHENYGYDLKGAVGKLAVAELKDPGKTDDLMRSLQKGNVQSVTIEKNGMAEKMFIEANPQFKTVNLYDGQMRRVQKENLEQYKSVGQGKDLGKDMKQDQSLKGDLKNDQKQDVKKDVKVHQDVGGEMNGTKKKTSRKKGMGV